MTQRPLEHHICTKTNMFDLTAFLLFGFKAVLEQAKPKAETMGNDGKTGILSLDCERCRSISIQLFIFYLRIYLFIPGKKQEIE